MNDRFSAALHWRRYAPATVLGLILFVAPGSAQELTGKGEWRSLSSDLIGGTWTATLVRKAGRVEGILSLTGSNILPGGAVSGDIDASSLMLGVMIGDAHRATFSAKLDGDSINGEWQCDAVKDHGVWYGTLKAVAARHASNDSQRADPAGLPGSRD